MINSGKAAVAQALDPLGVSRETLAKFELFETLLRKWGKGINLTGPDEAEHFWHRHVLDSLQLLRFARTEVWADVGSGAGFPGLVLGIIFASDASAKIHLIEANQGKAAFLHSVSRETNASVVIHRGRAEDILMDLPDVSVVTSRAVASLAVLSEWSRPVLERGGLGLFLKGKRYRDELTEAQAIGSLQYDVTPSLTDPAAAVIHVRLSKRP